MYTKKSFFFVGREMAGRVCMHAWCGRHGDGDGGRFHLVSHTQSISVIKRCGGFQRSEVDRHRV